MKLNYKKQLVLTTILILLGNFISTIGKHWIYRNIAFFLCGLLWIFHPIMAENRNPTKKERQYIQILGGGGLILIAFFTRSYVY